MNGATEKVRLVSASSCRLCGCAISAPPLSLGRLPVCNRFAAAGDVTSKVDLDIVECETCQLVQLREAPAIDALVPELPWIRYREPEGHLDTLVASVLDSFRPHARNAIGTGPFEQPLLTRLAARGIDVQSLELGVPSGGGRNYPYLESWQASLERVPARRDRVADGKLRCGVLPLYHRTFAGADCCAWRAEASDGEGRTAADRDPRQQQIPDRAGLLFPVGRTHLLLRRGDAAATCRKRGLPGPRRAPLSRCAGRRPCRRH